MGGRLILYDQPDIKDESGNWIMTKKMICESSVVYYRTRGYTIWSGITGRTNDKSKASIKNPSLLGNKNGFQDFNELVNWCQSQKGYTEKLNGNFWHLDKDILIPGNKTYSPKTCAFVPQHINKILNLNVHKRSKYPIGVHFHSQTGKYRAYLVRFDSKSKHLGLFIREEDAHKAWQIAKVLNMKGIINQYLTMIGSRQDVADALLLRVSKIQSDISSGLETKGWE